MGVGRVRGCCFSFGFGMTVCTHHISESVSGILRNLHGYIIGSSHSCLGFGDFDPIFQGYSRP